MSITTSSRAVATPVSDDGDKAFWISFADLMTALMVLFLMVMTVALLALTQALQHARGEASEQQRAIEAVMDEVVKAAKQFPGVQVDRERRVISFGDRARFETGSSQLTSEQVAVLRRFVPPLLAAVDSEEARGHVKQVVVEGFADRRGTYLFNLNLSMQRSQRVLCALLDPAAVGVPLTSEQAARVRALFAAGGYSTNSARDSYEESRRIELRLEFHSAGELQATEAGAALAELGRCAI
jgi:outer membrane protein OmpA-like peptidoglycan-associated protein